MDKILSSSILLFLCLIWGCQGPKQSESSEPAKQGITAFPASPHQFRASGNEPSWGLVISFPNKMSFTQLSAVPFELSTPLPTATDLPDGSGKQYLAETEGGTLEVNILNQACQDNMSGESFPHQVRIRAKTGDMTTFESFEGCGFFAGNLRLHDIWALEQLEGEKVDPKDFSKGVPTLELNLSKLLMYGHGGCNNLNGTIAWQQDSLKVGPIAATRMACPALQWEQKYTQALSDQVLAYSLKNLRLTLKNQAHELVFRKVD